MNLRDRNNKEIKPGQRVRLDNGDEGVVHVILQHAYKLQLESSDEKTPGRIVGAQNVEVIGETLVEETVPQKSSTASASIEGSSKKSLV